MPNDVVELIATGCYGSQKYKWVSKKKIRQFYVKRSIKEYQKQ